MRLAVPTYTGPIIRLQPNKQLTNAYFDFYTDANQTYLTTGANNTGSTFSDWLTANNSTFAYATIWYDQSGTGNHAINSNYSRDTQDTHPRLYLMTFSNGKSFYTLNWIPLYTMVLTLTTPITPNVISSIFYYSETPGTIASNTAGDYEVRFYNSSTLSNQNSNDWYYSSSGTKYSYVNGASTNTISTTTWNTMSLSVQTPYSQTIGQLGRDQGNNTDLSIHGYMFEFVCYNTQIPNSSFANYSNNAVILSSYTPTNALNTIIAQNTVGITASGYASSYTWNGYRVYKYNVNSTGSISFSGVSNGYVKAYVFMCGGGGGGGLSAAGSTANGGSGGGAGGSILTGYMYFQTGVTYTVTVGVGGLGSVGSGGSGTGGKSSIVGGIIYEEADGGLNGYQNSQEYNSASGGYVKGPGNSSAWHTSLAYHPNSSEGNGDRGTGIMQQMGGGGGGAGQRGNNPSGNVAGAGGQGYYFGWDQNIYFGSGGGGGAGGGYSGGSGGTGAGGGGGQYQRGGDAGTSNGGGGGGAGSNEDNSTRNGGTGASGIVIIYVFS
jgi:hypothetical protein